MVKKGDKVQTKDGRRFKVQEVRKGIITKMRPLKSVDKRKT